MGTNGPVKSALIQFSTAEHSLKIKTTALGKFGPISLVPPGGSTPQACAVLSIVGGDSYHAQFFTGVVKKNDAKELLLKDPIDLGLCVEAVTTTTSSTSTTTSSTSTTVDTTTTTSTSTTTSTLPAGIVLKGR